MDTATRKKLNFKLYAGLKFDTDVSELVVSLVETIYPLTTALKVASIELKLLVWLLKPILTLLFFGAVFDFILRAM